MKRRSLVVIGASAGGVAALLALCAGLPAGFRAPVLIVLHIGANTSVLPTLLAAHGNNPAVHAEDGQRLQSGTLYVAPPDQHMLIDGDMIRLRRPEGAPHATGDRSAVPVGALAHGVNVIGVVLTGRLDDGTARLKAIKDCGGAAIVVRRTSTRACRPGVGGRHADRCVPLADIAPTLVQLVAEPMPPAEAPSPDERRRLEREMEVFRGEGSAMERLNEIGKPSMFACPDCDGVLWGINDSGPARYRCHTGHAFTLRTLERSQAGSTEQALWGAIRALEQREGVLRKLAEHRRATGSEADARRREQEADASAQQAGRLHRMVAAIKGSTVPLEDA
jgi:two-component system chemotaxis response regulator CheB